MFLSISRGLAFGLLGALAGPAVLALLYGFQPAAAFDMYDSMPSFAKGFYPSELDGERSFSWTSRHAQISFAGMDRRADWSCSVRYRGAHPNPALPAPELSVGVDGVTAAVRPATSEFQDLDVVIPRSRGRSGAVLSLSTSPTFVPGPQDQRELGVQVDRIACAPAASAFVLPPRQGLVAAAVASGVFGAAVGLVGLTALGALAAVAVLAGANGVALVSGSAIYGAYPGAIVPFAAWIAFVAMAALKLLERWPRVPGDNTVRFVVMFSAVVLYLKIAALIHPAKDIVDALYHVHRFEAVLSGHFYFTQLSKSLTPFPYAIGLYLVAAPWSLLTTDYMTLLRVVVCAAEALAGLLLYPLVVRTWGDRLLAATAVILFHLVPIPYGIVGNANLTNAFGQSVALITVVAVAIATAAPRNFRHVIGLTLLTTLALLCHVSVVGLLLATLAAAAVLFAWFGGQRGRETAGTVVIVSVLAVLLATVSYYGHFPQVYKPVLARVGSALSGQTPPATATAPADAPAAKPSSPVAETERGSTVGRVYVPLSRRVLNAAVQTYRNIGWPILLLGVTGAWRVWAERRRGDRLTLVLGAWGLAALVFLVVAVPGAAETRYQKDAWEFIDRVELATFPAVVILAATGAVWCWRAGRILRLASAAVAAGALAIGWRSWVAWLQ